MIVHKFGGASVNSAAAIRNVASILNKQKPDGQVLVFSAMGKTTNAMEELVHEAYHQLPALENKIETVVNDHRQIIEELFGSESNPASEYLTETEQQIRLICKKPDCSYDEFYDRIVPFGELLSTFIISRYLNEKGLDNRLIPAFELIQTDKRFRDAGLNWEATCRSIGNIYRKYSGQLLVTQGFIGSSQCGKPTTLGREGSDFTAAVLAYCLDAQKMVVWKDVEGLLNADPVFFKNTVSIEQISYREAIELSYFGAKILHPKTIKPLQNKNIPLIIKSFFNPEYRGSLIHESIASDHLMPFFILKQDQMLISFSTRDFSFITEDNLKRLFEVFDQRNIRINMMQNSAISFSVCINNPQEKLLLLLDDLSNEFDIRYNQGLELLTIRHFTEEVIDEHLEGCQIFLEQRSRRTFQVVYKKN